MNVLVSSAGRRGALIQLIKQALAPIGGRVLAVDAGKWSSACRLADSWAQIPRCDQDDFLPAVLDYCRQHHIRLIIPTIDTELPIYAAHRGTFADHGIVVAVSGSETVAICGDKQATHQFLAHQRLPMVRQYSQATPLEQLKTRLPLVIKPRFGSASQGVQLVEDAEALEFYLGRTESPIVQELASGKEFTVNFFVDERRRCLFSVPHLRVETRGGEVSKCVTVKQPRLMELAAELGRCLPDAWGPMCFQAFVDESGAPRIIELNARFGGGYPVAHRAGADFIQCLVARVQGAAVPVPTEDWREGTAMTRWDDAVFTDANDVGLCA